MGRVLKYLFWAVLAGFVGLVAYSALWELPAPTTEITVPLPVPGQTE